MEESTGGKGEIWDINFRCKRKIIKELIMGRIAFFTVISSSNATDSTIDQCNIVRMVNVCQCGTF